ncbi:MAG: zeta toxin family protein [Chloroflexi bacterium]|nr:zeta toxin family protein [Chloroflexota bacterium]
MRDANRFPLLVIVGGAPGSGKTTLARRLGPICACRWSSGMT